MPTTEIEQFVAYLRETLIPDLRTSGFDATADDFEKCVEIIDGRKQTEATVKLSLSEYEASVITGALVEFSRHPDEADTANYLRAHLQAQLPTEWTEG
jgi:hypothetical protein